MILDVFTTSVVNEMTLSQELEIKKMIDNPKNSTAKSVLLELTMNDCFTLNQMAEVVMKVQKLLAEDIYMVLTSNTDSNLSHTTSYLRLTLSDNKEDFKSKENMGLVTN